MVAPAAHLVTGTMPDPTKEPKARLHVLHSQSPRATGLPNPKGDSHGGTGEPEGPRSQHGCSREEGSARFPAQREWLQTIPVSALLGLRWPRTALIQNSCRRHRGAARAPTFHPQPRPLGCRPTTPLPEREAGAPKAEPPSHRQPSTTGAAEKLRPGEGQEHREENPGDSCYLQGHPAHRWPQDPSEPTGRKRCPPAPFLKRV